MGKSIILETKDHIKTRSDRRDYFAKRKRCFTAFVIVKCLNNALTVLYDHLPCIKKYLSPKITVRSIVDSFPSKSTPV